MSELNKAPLRARTGGGIADGSRGADRDVVVAQLLQATCLACGGAAVRTKLLAAGRVK